MSSRTDSGNRRSRVGKAGGQTGPRPGARAERRAAPQTASQALQQARDHLRRAAAESLAAARALLDAAALASAGSTADEHPSLGVLARGLDELVDRLAAGEQLGSTPLLEAILDALDEEIGRWEVRSRNDDDARAVLRAFLGLREILWEFGLRPSGRRTAAAGQPAAARSDRAEQRENEPGSVSGPPDPSGPPPTRSKAPTRAKSAAKGRTAPPRVQRIEIQ